MLKISFNELKDSYEISYNGFLWVNDGRKSFVTVRKPDDKKNKDLLFKSAKSRKTEYSENKIVTRYSDFYLDGKKTFHTCLYS